MSKQKCPECGAVSIEETAVAVVFECESVQCYSYRMGVPGSRRKETFLRRSPCYARQNERLKAENARLREKVEAGQ